MCYNVKLKFYIFTNFYSAIIQLSMKVIKKIRNLWLSYVATRNENEEENTSSYPLKTKLFAK